MSLDQHCVLANCGVNQRAAKPSSRKTLPTAATLSDVHCPTRIFAVDCDDFNNTIDKPTGHTYFLRDGEGNPSPVFNHMMRSMLTGRVDADESTRTRVLDRDCNRPA